MLRPQTIQIFIPTGDPRGMRVAHTRWGQVLPFDQLIHGYAAVNGSTVWNIT